MTDTATESKFGFKNKEKAEETLQLLEDHDMQYRKLTVRGLLGRAKRVLSMTKAEEKVNNIKAAIEIFEKWLEENGGGAANKNSKTNVEDKVETVPGLGFKDKAAAEQTLKILEGRDPEYQQLAVKGLIRSSQRVLSGTANEEKIQNIKAGVRVLEDFLEHFETNNLIKNNRAYLAYNLIEPIIEKHSIHDKLAKEFLAVYGGSRVQGNYKHLRTLFPKDDESKSWDIVRNSHLKKILERIKADEAKLFDETGAPTSLHVELISWAYSPQKDKLKVYVDKINKKVEKSTKRKHKSSESSSGSSNSSHETPKKKQR